MFEYIFNAHFYFVLGVEVFGKRIIKVVLFVFSDRTFYCSNHIMFDTSFKNFQNLISENELESLTNKHFIENEKTREFEQNEQSLRELTKVQHLQATSQSSVSYYLCQHSLTLIGWIASSFWILLVKLINLDHNYV